MKHVSLDTRWTLAAAAAAFILFAALQVGYVIGLGHTSEAPRNFDPFGYLRQAQLFQTHGLIGGLDTSFRDATSEYLTEVAKQLDPNPLNWSYQIAPPAHHFEPRTGHIIDLYPPGTGFFLHFYREGMQQRSSQFVFLTVVFLSLSLCLWLSNSFIRILSVALVGTPLMVAMFRDSFSYSIHLSLAFSALIGLLGTLVFYRRGRSQIAIAAFMGLVIGLSVSIRFANILFFFGYIPILWVVLRSPDRAAGLTAVVTACIVGMLPLMVAQQINTGIFFQTAYTARETGASVFDPTIGWRDLAAYFGGTKRDQLTNWLALLALGGAFAYGVYRRLPLFPILPAVLNLAIGIGFFAFYPFTLPYYLMSNAVGALSGAAAYIWLSAPARTESRYGFFPQGVMGLIAVSSILLLSAYFYRDIKPTFDRNELAQKLRDSDIVYACETAGLFVQSGIYAACLVNGDFDFAQKLVRRVSAEGRRQFVVVENSVAQALLDRVCPAAGQRKFLDVVGFDLFMIPPNLGATSPDCAAEHKAQD